MKKITIIVVAALAVSFASCKKAKTCTCSDTFGTYTETFDKVSSSTANSKCPTTVTHSSTNGGTTTSSSYTCKLS